jgi:hypothetical protein
MQRQQWRGHLVRHDVEDVGLLGRHDGIAKYLCNTIQRTAR